MTDRDVLDLGDLRGISLLSCWVFVYCVGGRRERRDEGLNWLVVEGEVWNKWME